MVLELADLRVNVGMEAQFERNVHIALADIFPKSRGFVMGDLRRSIESPQRYILSLTWETLEDHTIGFRESSLFQEWRALVTSSFAAPPQVEHFRVAKTPA